MNDGYSFTQECEKDSTKSCRVHEISDEQMEIIAEKAAKKAVQYAKDDIYKDVGRTVINKLYWLVGLIIVGAALWLSKEGVIKL